MYVGSFISSIGQEIKVRATNGVFMRYAFTDKDNQYLVKRYMNVFINYIRKNNPISSLEILGDNIEITAEYDYFKSTKGATPKQDFQIKENNKLLYLEIQSTIDTKNPLFGRAIVYFALSFVEAVGETYEKKNQLWLCMRCEDNIVSDEVAFEEYLFRGAMEGKVYPNTSSITIIDLQKLSRLTVDDPAIRLAQYLVNLTYVEDSDVVDIITGLQKSFDKLKSNKQKLIHLENFNLAKEEGLSEGRADGISQGISQGIAQSIISTYKVLQSIDLLLQIYPSKTRSEIESIIKGE